MDKIITTRDKSDKKNVLQIVLSTYTIAVITSSSE